MHEFATESKRRGIDFVVIGDSISPPDFALDGCDYYSIDHQLKTGFQYAGAAPLRHYARKNIGYLVSIASGTDIIVESDDDNYPLPGFWSERRRIQQAHVFEKAGWLNIYAYFSTAHIWPRGLPLDAVRQPVPPLVDVPLQDADCPIQQGLCNGDPDVDAIYRLVNPLPIDFQEGSSVALANNAWCPFNSQNTAWWSDAFPLLYLPGTCSIRMTDIWRGFVAQRIAWANGWNVLFHAPTVYQERNAHNLMRDFRDEICGYLHNRSIAERFEDLDLEPGIENIPDNMRLCYGELAKLGLVEARELNLLEAWLSDLAEVESSRSRGAQVGKC
jgi:STELLO glycosyltransferases